MRRKYKFIMLIAAAALTMTVLVVVNMQASQDKGSRRPAVSIVEDVQRTGAVWF